MDSRIVVLDLETGGLDWRSHPVTQIAAIACTDDFSPIEEYEAKLQFDRALATEDALAMNHFDAGVWARDAKHPGVVVGELASFFRRHATLEAMGSKGLYTVAQLMGQNVSFDGDFLRRLYREPGWQVGEQRSRVFLPAYPRGLDTCQLAQWAVRVLGLAPPKDFKLGTLCALLEIEVGDAHDALIDARLTIEVARRLTSALRDGELRRDAA